MLTTAAVIAAMCVAYATYARLTRPMLLSTVVRNQPKAIAAPPIPTGLKEIATDVLGWQHPPKYVFNGKNERTRLMFNSFHPDGQRVLLQPFAFVAYDPERPSVPFVIKAEAGRIEFDEFDPLRQRVGKILDGDLIGDVEVEGPDGLVLSGRDFGVTASAIFTDHPVSFTFGPSNEPGKEMLLVKGRAGKFTAELFSAGPGDKPPLGDVLPPWTGIQSLWLRSDVEIEVLSDRSTVSRQEKPDHLTIACDREVKYTVESREAVFKENVRVLHSNSKAGSGLNLPAAAHGLSGCSTLTLRFEDNGDVTAPSVANFSLALALRTIEAIATGGRAGDAAQLQLDSFADRVQAFGGKLYYDLFTREAILSSTGASLSPRPRFVAVRLGEQELFCPVVRIQTDEDSQLVKASFPGPGVMRTGADLAVDGGEKIPAVQANWDREVIVEPVLSAAGEKQMRVIALGDVSLAMPEHETTVTAPKLVAWLDEPERRLGDLTTAGHPLETAGTTRRRNPLRRVLANGEANEVVRVVRPDLDVQATNLFELVVVPIEEVTNPIRRTSSESTADGSTASANKQPGQPLVGRADRLGITIGTQEQDVEVLGFTAESNVFLEQKAEIAGRPPQLRVVGERAVLSGRGLAQQLAFSGNATTLQFDGVTLSAGHVVADRAAETITVPGRGVLTIPMSGDLAAAVGGTEATAGPTSKPTDARGELTIAWSERVEFHGERVTFYGDVQTKQDETTVHCDQLYVTLTRPLEFSNLDSEALSRLRTSPIDLASLTFRHRVEVTSEDWDGTEMRSLRTARLAELSFDRETERLHGVGPGVVSQWSRIEPKEGDRASASLKPYRLSKVEFVGELEGHSGRQWLRLSRSVKALSGVVARPLIDLTRDQLLDLPGQPDDAFWIGCDSLEVSLDPSVTPGTSSSRARFDASTIQAQAVGNVEVEGQQFRAIADMANVNRATGLVTVNGNGGNLASVWRQESPNAPATQLKARSYRINFEKRTFEADGSSGLYGGR